MQTNVLITAAETNVQHLPPQFTSTSAALNTFKPIFCPPQGNKEVKSPKSPMADIPSGGTRSIKSMWEKGNVGGSSESPAPASKVRDRGMGKGGGEVREIYWYMAEHSRRLSSQDVAPARGSVTGRLNNWAKPAEAEKTAAPAPSAAPAPAPAPAPAASSPSAAKPAVSPPRPQVKTLFFNTHKHTAAH